MDSSTDLSGLKFFDANCGVGVPMNGAWACSPDVSDLLAELDRVGVARALVASCNAANGAAARENAMVSEKFARHAQVAAGRLYACWTFLPEQCGELPHGRDLLNAMAEHNVRALEICPASHRWIPRRSVVGSFFDLLAQEGIPVIFRLNSEAVTWDRIYDVFERFPENSFIIASTGVWGCDRFVRPLLDACRGAYFETGEYWNAGGLASLTAACGHDRILFGSNYPRNNHGQAMLNIRHAEISSEAKIAIAGGNLARLLRIDA